MKKILLFLFLCINLCGIAQNVPHNQVDSQGKKQGLWKKYEGKTLIYEGAFEHDIPVGEFTYYHPNGSVKSKTFFINGISKVKTTLYHENGKKASEGVFIDQQKDGKWVYYNNQGTEIKVESYRLGKREGLWETFSARNGMLLAEENYAQDMLEGTCKTYYAEGELSSVSNYINGKLNGSFEFYYPDKILAITGLYHNNIKTGIWNHFDHESHLRKSMDYNHRDIKTVLYFYNGSVSQQINQDLIAYFLKEGDKVSITLKNGNIIKQSESMETLVEWIDFLVFTRVSPNLIAANDAIKGYTDINDTAVSVKIVPPLQHDIIVEGDDAKMIRQLFDKTVPKE